VTGAGKEFWACTLARHHMTKTMHDLSEDDLRTGST